MLIKSSRDIGCVNWLRITDVSGTTSNPIINVRMTTDDTTDTDGGARDGP